MERMMCTCRHVSLPLLGAFGFAESGSRHVSLPLLGAFGFAESGSVEIVLPTIMRPSAYIYLCSSRQGKLIQLLFADIGFTNCVQRSTLH